MKIAIVGSPGSGKSTLAQRLHEILKIPLYHLDQYFWKPGWVRPDQEQFKKNHHELCDKKSYILEGMAIRHFDYRIEKADLIIFLDIPLSRCLYRIFKRAFLCFGKVSSAGPKGCPERFPDREFLSYVWNFNRKHKPIIENLLEKYKGQKKIFVVKNNTQLDELVKKAMLGQL